MEYINYPIDIYHSEQILLMLLETNKTYMMNRLRLFCCMLIFHSFLYIAYSQYLTPIEINAGSNEINTDNLIFSSSLGSFAVTSISFDSILFTQGFQQTDTFFTSKVIFDSTTQITAYPNPCINYVSIYLKNLKQPTNSIIEIYSSLGKINRIVTPILMENNIPVKVWISNLDAGIYVIKIFEHRSNRPIGNIKILKISASK